MPEEQDPDAGLSAFPITFRGYDPDAVHARIEELEAIMGGDQVFELAVARSEARLAELDAALARALDPAVAVAERSKRLTAAIEQARQAVDVVRRLRSSS